MVRPQAGPQEMFLRSPADIVIYGGGAGGGKSWAILMEALRYCHIPGFNATFFRRSYPQIKNPGGLWDASMGVFPLAGAVPRASDLRWSWPSGAYSVMRHMKLESNVLDWQGTELVYVAMDELTHFTEFMFWYITSRLRSTTGIQPYFRGTCNPTTADDPIGGWVRLLIDWWIGEDGFPIPERAGVVRHFERHDGQLTWTDEPTDDSKSFTFIPATVYDNPALLKKDPNYLKNLKALPQVERDRLLGGNWNVKAIAGKWFQQHWFVAVERKPQDVTRWVRFWDFAATAEGKDPDWTVGVLMGLRQSGGVVIADVKRDRLTPGQVNQIFQQTTYQDGRGVACRWFQDPGQAGVYQSNHLRSLVQGFDARGVTSQISKRDRAKPFSTAAEFGEVMTVAGDWNIPFFNELVQFPDGAHDDQVDAAGGAYLELTGEGMLKFGTSKFR
jgi:predicted phage terminase large subunit-like protein